MTLTATDWSRTMHETAGEQPDRQLLFLRALIDDNAAIAGDIAEIATNRWAIHGVIPVDGEVVMAEFDSYDQARVVLDSLSAGDQGVNRSDR